MISVIVLGPTVPTRLDTVMARSGHLMCEEWRWNCYWNAISYQAPYKVPH